MKFAIINSSGYGIDIFDTYNEAAAKISSPDQTIVNAVDVDVWVPFQ